MFTLFKWALLATGIAAVVAFVPINGRTALARWNEAKSVSGFAGRSWQELKKGLTAMTDKQLGRSASSAPTGAERPRRAGAHQKPKSSPAASPAPVPTPVPMAHYTDAERKAVDKIVAERLKR